MDLCRIPLSRGLTAVIDVADFPLVSKFKWHASPSLVGGGGYYATASAKNAAGAQTTIYMHRILTGAPKGKVVDHINRDPLDNRRANLRICTQVENSRNSERCEVTACPAGHPYDEQNTHINKKGHRICRPCAKLRMREVMAAEGPEGRERRRVYARAHYLKTRKIAGPGRIQV